MDSYATSKQCALAATLAFAGEMPRLRFNAVEPGITPGTGLGGPNVFLSLLFRYVITFLPPFAQYRSTPERTARVIAAILTDESGKTGVYYDEKGRPMLGSEFARDPKFQERVVAETRALLATCRWFLEVRRSASRETPNHSSDHAFITPLLVVPL